MNRILACVSLAFAVTALPAHAQNKMPTSLKEASECMLKALKDTPGVSGPRLGSATTDGWTHPFLEYSASEKTRWVQPTRFDLQKPSSVNRGPYTAMAMLPGLMGAGQKPDLHVTNLIIQKWKTTCSVEASLLFV